ncbi:hypothetical protein M0Q97_09175 [Candidatus Dojkabacteria bacterium]|jgi:hypothetical protein|nr:hypothetical protein [Candidatus Dojkabacteria bacterium]
MKYKDFKDNKDLTKNIKTLIELRWCLSLYGKELSNILNVESSILYKISSLDLDKNIDILKFFKYSLKELDDFQNDLNSKKDFEYFDDYYISTEHSNALLKNANLIEQLQTSRENFCGIGTNKVKRRLNKLSKIDNVALAIRIALEIEDKNISAKNSYGKYKDKIYETKHSLILNLVDVFEEENWTYGVENNNGRDTNGIIYFEIPNTEQISWHFDIKNNKYKKYDKIWDGKTNSTLKKLENKIIIDYNKIIK